LLKGRAVANTKADDDAKGATAKLLQKWRPHVLQEVPNGTSAGVEVKEESKMSLTAET